MPTKQDPTQVEAAEVAEKATGAAVTGPSQADVTASEVFGEDTQEDTSPLARLKKKKAELDQRVDERQKKEDEEHRRAWLEQARLKKEAAEKERQEKEVKEQMARLGEGISQAAQLQIMTTIGECADELEDPQLMNKVVETLDVLEKAKGKNSVDLYPVLLAIGESDQTEEIVNLLHKKGIDLKTLIADLKLKQKFDALNGVLEGQNSRLFSRDPDTVAQLKRELKPLQRLLKVLGEWVNIAYDSRDHE